MSGGTDETPARWIPSPHLALALLGTALVAGPALFGLSLDVPDDYVYHGLIPWEWLRDAWQQGRSPWWIPGVVGGSSLLSDAIYMGPFYPATWSLLLLPAHLAYPLTCVAHALLAVLSVRWLARTLGASELSACLAGAAIGIGPIATLAVTDGRSTQWPLIVWMPVAFGCLERARAVDPARWRWVAGAGAALGLAFVGGHPRMTAAACCTLALWALVSRLPLRVSAVALMLGLLLGAPGFAPVLLDWGEASSSAGVGSLYAMLAGPAYNGLHWDNLSGWLVPAPTGVKPDYSIGVALGLATVLGWGRRGLRWSAPAGRLVLLWATVAACVFAASVPGLRYLAAPIILVTHPVNEVYLLVVVPLAAATGAVALDDLLDRDLGAAWTRARAGVIAAALVGSLVVLVTRPGVLDDGRAPAMWLLGWGRVVVALALVIVALRRRRRGVVFAVALADLLLYSAGLNAVVPSPAFDLNARAHFDATGLEEGYADLVDLARFEPFRYQVREEEDGTEYAFGGHDPLYSEFALGAQAELHQRLVPVGLGAVRGIRALAGEHKLTPSRTSEAVAPLVRLLLEDDDVGDEGAGSLRARNAVAPGSPGARVLALYGLPVAVWADGRARISEPLAPRCYSPPAVRVEPSSARRVEWLTSRPFAPRGPALLESPPPFATLAPAAVACDEEWVVQVEATGPALVVLNERYHRGWSVTDDTGASYGAVPVNQVHLGVFVPAGKRTLTLRFAPPGLDASLAASGVSLVFLGLLAFRGGLRRRGFS